VAAIVEMDFHAVFTIAAQGTALMRCILYTALPALRTEVLFRLNKAHMKVITCDNIRNYQSCYCLRNA
jgi:hypothetical protein